MPVKLLMTSCQSTSDIIAMHGVDKDLFQSFREYVIDDAGLTAFKNKKDGALVGDRIAARYGWKIGQNVTLTELKGVSFNVCGIFTTHGTADDFVILAGRKFLQEADEQQGISNMILVKLAPNANATKVKQQIDDLPFTFSPATQSEKAHLSAALEQLSDLVAVSQIVIGVIVFVILIAMGNAIAMATRERSREFGILRTLGYSRRAILSLVIGEGFMQTIVGGLLGCLTVQLIISFHLVKSISTCGFTVGFTAGPFVWSVGLGVIIAAGVCGSFIPAVRAANLDIVTAIRRND